MPLSLITKNKRNLWDERQKENNEGDERFNPSIVKKFKVSTDPTVTKLVQLC